jgi:hypothetical protein
MLTYGELEYDIALDHREDPEILKLVGLTTIEPHDGPFLDATVTVTLDDGTRIERESSQSPRTMIFQDRRTATDQFASRLGKCGYGPKLAPAIADIVFAAAEGRAPGDMRQVLDQFAAATAA